VVRWYERWVSWAIESSLRGLQPELCSQESRRRYAAVKLPGGGELLVQRADGAAVAPGRKLHAELAHVLEVGGDLLAGASVKASAPSWQAASMLP
jgi:hypothetical protein